MKPSVKWFSPDPNELLLFEVRLVRRSVVDPCLFYERGDKATKRSKLISDIMKTLNLCEKYKTQLR